MYDMNVDEYGPKWGISSLQKMRVTPNNCIYKGVRTSDGLAVILKCTKCRIKAHYEAMALKWFAGNACPNLLCYDDWNGVILQEQIFPAVHIIDVFKDQDMEAIKCCVEVIKRLHHAPLEDASKHQSLISYFGPLFSPVEFPAVDIEYFRGMVRWLISTMKNPVLLHADLHHRNIILRGEDDWIAIDPRGVVGEVAYEAAPFVCCYQLPRVKTKADWAAVLRDRVELFSELLQVDKTRLQAWVTVFAARKACTFLNKSKVDLNRWLGIAQTLRVF